MLKSNDSRAGIACLKLAIETAQAKGAGEYVNNLRFQLAEELGKLSYYSLAAEELRLILESCPEPDEYGKAATTRIKCLYDAGRFGDIVREAPDYYSDQRCKSYRPTILYLLWEAHRHQGQPELANTTQEILLKEFPENPLCAGIYLYSAMNALKTSHYGEAQRMLEIIKQRYPQSSVTPKVQQLREQLDRTLANSSHLPEAPQNK